MTDEQKEEIRTILENLAHDSSNHDTGFVNEMEVDKALAEIIAIVEQ